MEYHKNLDLASIHYFCELDLIWKIEEWRDVVGYEFLYQVSDLGRLKSLNYRRMNKAAIIKLCVDNTGYIRISLSKNKKSKSFALHVLVSIIFLGHIPNGHKLVINHKDFIRSNNMISNLEIITNRENTNKKHIQGTSKYVGVYFHKRSGKWLSRIRIGKVHKYLGIFEKENDAAQAYNDKLNEISK